MRFFTAQLKALLCWHFCSDTEFDEPEKWGFVQYDGEVLAVHWVAQKPPGNAKLALE